VSSNSAGIKRVHIDLEDLQEVEILAQRRNLSKGELSAIAFARRTGQAILTDDQKARRLAETALASQYAQTVPHLAAWLLYEGYVGGRSSTI
jgi:predicted nucleic acid-binding protein